MNFIIWNCRGAQSPKFRCNFRSLLDYHRLSLVALLETHHAKHQNLKEDFNFTGIANVPAIGQSEGIAIVWHCDALTVEPLATAQQEIHCTIQVHPLPYKWLFTSIYASTDSLNKQLL